MQNKTTIAEWVAKEIARQTAQGNSSELTFQSPEEIIIGYLEGKSVNMVELADYSVREIVEFCQNATSLVEY